MYTGRARRQPQAHQHADPTSRTAVDALFSRLDSVDHLVFTAGEELLLGKLAELDLVQARTALELRMWGALTAIDGGGVLV